MKLKSRVEVAAHPDLTFTTHFQPFGVELGGEAALDVRTGQLSGRVAAVPVTLAVPFMPSHRGRVVVGTIGPIEVQIKPAEAQVGVSKLRLKGVAGTDGLKGQLTALGKCRAEIEAAGEMPARILKAAVEGVFDEEQ